MSILAFPAAVGRSVVNESIVPSEPNPFTSKNRQRISMRHRSRIFPYRDTTLSGGFGRMGISSLISTSAITPACIAASTIHEPQANFSAPESTNLKHVKHGKRRQIRSEYTVITQ